MKQRTQGLKELREAVQGKAPTYSILVKFYDDRFGKVRDQEFQFRSRKYVVALARLCRQYQIKYSTGDEL